MWYLEMLISLCIIGVLGTGIYYADAARERYEVDCETLRLVNVLTEVQERSRRHKYTSDERFLPSCHIYEDKYIIRRTIDDKGETYYLQNGVKIDLMGHSGFFYLFKQNSLYGNTANKTLKVYKNNSSKYIAISRIGRIRVYNIKS